MLIQLSIVALVGVAACSGTAEAPHMVRDPSKTTELGIFMKTRMNPSFSKISFLLFHEEDSETEIDPAALPASAAELARAAELLGKWPELPGESEESKLVFHEYADSLKTDAAKLIEALRTKQWDGARKVFDSLHRKCDACHHFFRYDQSSVLELAGKPAAPRP
jgi:cytochrome c556